MFVSLAQIIVGCFIFNCARRLSSKHYMLKAFWSTKNACSYQQKQGGSFSLDVNSLISRLK